MMKTEHPHPSIGGFIVEKPGTNWNQRTHLAPKLRCFTGFKNHKEVCERVPRLGEGELLCERRIHGVEDI